ncbi:MAG: helix-turn-helix transcriptional regulator [Actinobacteria bacterium]|nr:helix-turn-helix transcriptional regulator [Actinomycetota bacterium]
MAVAPREREQVAEGEQDDDLYIALAETFRALADSTRARLVCLLMGREMFVTDLAERLGVSESAVSQHLRVLRAQGLVRFRRSGQHVYYTLADEHIEQIIGIGLEHLGHTLEALAPVAPETS